MSGNDIKNDSYYIYGQQFTKLCNEGKHEQAQKTLLSNGFSEGSIFNKSSEKTCLNQSFKNFINGAYGDKQELTYTEIMPLYKGIGAVSPLSNLNVDKNVPKEELNLLQNKFAKREASCIARDFIKQNKLQHDIIDGDSSDKVSTYIQLKEGETLSKEEIKKLLKNNIVTKNIIDADKNKDGKIDTTDFYDPSQLDEQAIKNIDIDKDGKINKKEFATYLAYIDGYESNGKLEIENIEYKRNEFNEKTIGGERLLVGREGRIDVRSMCNDICVYGDAKYKVYDQCENEQF